MITVPRAASIPQPLGSLRTFAGRPRGGDIKRCATAGMSHQLLSKVLCRHRALRLIAREWRRGADRDLWWGSDCDQSTDILPDINIPIASVIWTYDGLSADDMSKRIMGVCERAISTTVKEATT